MKIRDLAVILCLCMLIFESCSPLQSQSSYVSSCSKTPKLELESLVMFPDPLPEARKIDQWRAIVRSDSSDICRTTLSIVDAESKQLISRETKTELSLGANEILLYSLDDYRLSGKEICFEVDVYISGTKVALDSARRFCARTIDRGWWSMR